MRVIALFAALGFALAFAAAPPLAHAQTGDDEELSYLYKVSLVRAAPGMSIELARRLADLESARYYRGAQMEAPYVWRHSQGDHWDLILIYPVGSYETHFAADNMEARTRADRQHRRRLAAIEELVAFKEDLFAYGPTHEEFADWAGDNELLHVEMFHALPGKKGELLAQRRMENAYLIDIGRDPNLVWSVDAGGDVDIFTIGFYPGWQAFAAPARVDLGTRDLAAERAGFVGVEDIGLSLRRLISGHHDTFAVPIE